MKKIHLLHNPAAGAGSYDKKNLIEMIESAGYHCSYSSTKKEGWSNVTEFRPDFIAVAGGDGTVRKLARELLGRNVLDHNYPIALLPLGTANNIAKALGMYGTPENVIKAWEEAKVKRFDVGRIYGVDDHEFFLEGFGYGVFPTLVQEMRKLKTPENPEESKKLALKTLYDVVHSFKARYCEIVADGVEYSGKYLLAEVMNIRSIGPNLYLAPAADPGDGFFDLVIIREEEREALASYIHEKIQGNEVESNFTVIRAKDIGIAWAGKHLHIDDQIVSGEKYNKVKLELREGLMEFFMPFWKD
jgi:diacylglycerol kinase (ATP)